MVINMGVSFGLFKGISAWVIVIVLLGLVVYALKMRELWGRVGVGLIVLGGVGNLVSRVKYGGVVDNLNFLGLFYNNVWDYLIVIGAIIYFGSHRARPRR